MPVARVPLIAQTIQELTVIANIAKGDLTHSNRVDSASDLSALKGKLDGLFEIHARVDKALLDTLPDIDIEHAKKVVLGFLEELKIIQNYPNIPVAEMAREREQLVATVESRRKATSDFWIPRLNAIRTEAHEHLLNALSKQVQQFADLSEKIRKDTDATLKDGYTRAQNEIKGWATTQIAEQLKQLPWQVEAATKKAADDRWSGLSESVVSSIKNFDQLSAKFKKFETEAVTRIDAAVKKASEFASTPDSLVRSAETALTKIRAIAGEAGVSKYTEVFKSAATSHREAARAWLIGAALSVVGFGLVFSWILWWSSEPVPESTIAQLVYKAAPKIIALPVLTTVLTICVRSFRIHRHNEVVNEHRSNALTTFEAFNANAASDKHTRAALMVQATQTIFGHADTGFVVYSGDEQSPSNMIELINTASGLARGTQPG